jgi:hypothetical protein
MASMKSTDISYYFALYLVAIITVFAITLERDEAFDVRDHLIADLLEVYLRPLKLSPYADTSRFYIQANRSQTDDSIQVKFKVEGPLITDDVEYAVLQVRYADGRGTWQDKSPSGRFINQEGDGIFLYPPLSEGIYEFTIAGHKNRVRIDGRHMSIPVKDTVYEIPYSKTLEAIDLDTTVLVVKVTKSGIEPNRLVLTVSEKQENWVVGVPYVKKIFVSGVEDVRFVKFQVSPTGRISLPTTGESFVSFTWDEPIPGKKQFTVSANANRGFGEKDQANIGFEVNVQPAMFETQPAEKGFWGIPYQFDGKIVGLNPLDLSVEILHDNEMIDKKPVVPKISVTPMKDWATLRFKVVYRGVVLKEHTAEILPPAPPQIKWVQQNYDKVRDVFEVTVVCTDAGGGAVKLSVQSQPTGIARLDKFRGTEFKITCNVKDKPPSVFLKLTATDDFGGQSTSSKQFPLQ